MRFAFYSIRRRRKVFAFHAWTRVACTQATLVARKDRERTRNERDILQMVKVRV